LKKIKLCTPFIEGELKKGAVYASARRGRATRGGGPLARRDSIPRHAACPEKKSLTSEKREK